MTPKSRDGIRLADTSGLARTAADDFARAPFMPRAVRFRVIESWAEGESNALTHAVAVAYIDSRAVIERLNMVYPGQWCDAYQHGDRTVTCFLTVNGQALEDVGEGYSTRKALVADALKRAAVKTGIGVSLYAVPKVPLSRLAPDDEDDIGPVLLREWREQVNGEWRDTLTLTLEGERYCRDRYRSWLLKTGIPAFGYPIDHGDVADCPGMAEINSPAPRKPKASRSRERSRVGPAAPEPAETLSPEAELMALLAITEDGLHAERFACDSAMKAYGVEPAKRLQELTAAKDRRGLEALLVRLSNVPKSDDEQPIENGDTTA